MIVFVGDIHGMPYDMVGHYNGLLKGFNNQASKIPMVQVGDAGLGWMVASARPKANAPIYWIDGNHEQFNDLRGITKPTEVYPGYIYLPRGTVLELDGKLCGFLGGGDSIDRKYRVEGYDWFRDEVITYADCDRLLKNVGNRKLDYLVTHSPPVSFVEIMRHGDVWEEFAGCFKAVQGVWEALGKPYSISGHMHESYTFNGYGKILRENEYYYGT